MRFLYQQWVIYMILLPAAVSSFFTPDQSSYDAYGLKIAANDVLLVQSVPNKNSFSLFSPPDNYWSSCTIVYNDTDQYIYAVAVAQNTTMNDTIRFVFIGVNANTSAPFIGSLTYADANETNNANATISTANSVSCDGWSETHYDVHTIDQFLYDTNEDNINHLDFMVVAVEPMGHFAYAFTQQFIALYNLDTNRVSIQLGNVTWKDSSFLPHAVDISQDYVVVLGYVGDPSTKYTPYAYLLSRLNSTLQVLDQWMYTAPTNKSWQASLTNWDAGSYSPQYDTSVSINPTERQVLLGIQVTNTIILLDIDRATNKFRLPKQSLSNGKAIGLGKAVGWFDATTAVVLVNTYSQSYTWLSSQVFTYNTSIFNSSGIISIFPNIYQPLGSGFGPILITLLVTQTGIVIILDSQGNINILPPAPPGTFSDTTYAPFTFPSDCAAGSFNAQPSIGPCSPCSQGTSTNGFTGQTSCTPCDNGAFCPLGAVFGNISSSSPLLNSIDLPLAYPVSPQSVRFDNILIQNMLYLRVPMSSHCVVISPFFWALIAILLGTIIAILMLVLKHCVTNRRSKITRKYAKTFFKQIDLIGEGELWMGGIITFPVVILAISAYVFSASYFHRYPIERITGGASFACDPTLANAQFSSGLMSLAVATNDDAVPMVQLLDAQPFTLQIDLVNTLFQCDDLTLTQAKSTSISLDISTCDDSDGSVSISVRLPTHSINMQLSLAGIEVIGGFRLGLTGPGAHEENQTVPALYTLVDSEFGQAFFVSGQFLAQEPSFTVQLTKIINRTYPIDDGGETEFSARWTALIVNNDDNFIDANKYKYATSSQSTISIVIGETPYYISNTQRPITDQAELIFTDLLFTILCIEMFGLLFLILRLGIIPLIKRLWRCCHRRQKTDKSFEDIGKTFPDRF